jgi:replication fork protection complex subunit Tof1/Swi1
VIVETLGPKSRNKWKDLSSYKSDEEEDDGMGGQRARIQEKVRRPPDCDVTAEGLMIDGTC